MTIDVTTLALAVDSTQVNTANAALDKFAASGARAEGAAAGLAKTSEVTGRSLASTAVGAGKAAVSFKTLEEAQATLGPKAAAALAQANTALGTTQVKADAAATAMHRLGTESAQAGAQASSALASPVKPQTQTRAPAPTTNNELLIGPQATAALAGVTSELRAVETKANDAAAAIRRIGEASVSAGSKAKNAFSTGAIAPTATPSQASADISKVTNSLAATASEAAVATQAVGALRQEVTLTDKAVAGAAAALGSVVSPQGSGLRAAIERRGATAGAELAGALGGRVLSSASPTDTAAAKQAIKDVEELGNKSNLSTQQVQGLIHSVRAFFDQVASGGSPLRAAAVETGKLSGTFGGVGNALSAITSLITPFRLAVGGAAAAVGLLAFAMIEGQKRSKEFADAILLSGNFAAKTEGQFNALTIAISQSKSTTEGNARAIAQALLATGQIGPEIFDKAASAAVGFGKATGQTAEEVAKSFAKMTDSPSKFAEETNKQLNFLTAAQYAEIKALEENGQAAQAQGIIFDALNERFPKLGNNVNSLTKLLGDGQNAWTRFWASAIAPATVEDRIAQVQTRIARLQQAQALPGAPALLQSAQVELGDLRQQRTMQEQAATTRAADEAQNKAAISGQKVIDSYLARGKSADVYNQKLKELNKAFADNEAKGVTYTAAQKKLALDTLKDEFTKKGGGAGRGNEAQQVLDAQLEQQIKAARDALGREKDDLAFSERFLQGVYQAGEISLVDFYDQKRKAIAAGTDAEIAELETERTKVQAHLEATKKTSPKDASALVKDQTRINEIDADIEKRRLAGSRESTLSVQEQTAAQKALNEQVENYRAALLQLQGDEVGAARIRAQIAQQQASDLAARAQKSGISISPVELAANKKALDDQITLNQVKSQSSFITQTLAIQEERVALAQSTGAAGEIEALTKLGAARQEAAAALEKQVADLERIAKENPLNLPLQIDASRARLELDKLKSELDPLKEKFDNMFKDAGANLFGDLLNGTKPLQALKNFGAAIAKQMNDTVSKELSNAVFGKGGIFGGAGGAFADLFGGKDRKAGAIDTSAAEHSLSSLATSGVDPATGALVDFTAALRNATGSLATPGDLARADRQAVETPTTGDFARADRGQTAVTGEQSVMDLFRSADTAAGANDKAAASALNLASAAARGGNAMSLLPSIINAIQAAAAAGGGGGGGLLGSIGSLFGGSSSGGGFGTGAAYGNLDYGSFFHAGGIVGQTNDRRPVPANVFEGATKYHVGGIVGGHAKAGLAAHEVPAILMGGPKGVREEVLHASDPRHRDRISPALAKALLGGHIPRYHTGGIVGQSADVLRPMTGGYLTTSRDAEPASAGAQGGNHTFNLNVHVPQGANSATAHQLGAAALRGAADAARRNGIRV
jgi:hypothetical protein